MSKVRTFKQGLATVTRFWDKKACHAALAEVERLLEAWPGNAHLHVLWASLVQLQEEPTHGLDEAKRALQQAVQLDKSSPTAAIELGHFLDAVEDDPQAAARSFSEGAAAARQLLIEGLTGQAKALLRLNKREEALHCVAELLHLMQFEPGPKRNRSNGADLAFVESGAGRVFAVQVKGPFPEQVEELLHEVISSRSA
jgi:hypothetical protein